MVNYREILRLAADGSYSIRQIKATVHCSHDTIRETLDVAVRAQTLLDMGGSLP